MEEKKRILVHHGIAGQKWGRRNGPPYPLDYSDHSAAEKRGDYQYGDKKDKPLKNFSARAELTGNKRTDKKIIKNTYNAAKYAKAASVLAKSESDRALKKSGKKVGNKSEALYGESQHLNKQAKKAEENAKYFNEKFQRQAKEFADKYGKESFNRYKTDFVNDMSVRKATRFIANDGIAKSYLFGSMAGKTVAGTVYRNEKGTDSYKKKTNKAGMIGGMVGAATKSHSNYKNYRQYIDSL